jgi:hypothetical protein
MVFTIEPGIYLPGRLLRNRRGETPIPRELALLKQEAGRDLKSLPASFNLSFLLQPAAQFRSAAAPYLPQTATQFLLAPAASLPQPATPSLPALPSP